MLLSTKTEELYKGGCVETTFRVMLPVVERDLLQTPP